MNYVGGDKLGRRAFGDKLINYLLIEDEYVSGSLVVSLNGPFGSGKSTFLKHWKHDLEMRAKEEKELPRVIELNAWESDFCNEPLLAISAGLVAALEAQASDAGAGRNHAQAIREALKDCWWFAVGLGNSFVANSTGLDINAAGDLAKAKKEERAESKPDIIETFESRKKAVGSLRDALKKAFGGERPQAIILVDELDRCRPDYAVHYLEAIKHVFDIEGLIFVLAVDYAQLSCSARALFGGDLIFSEYFRKFAHRSIELPEPNKNEMREYVVELAKRYVVVNGKRHCFLDFSSGTFDRIVDIACGLSQTPRQVDEVFRITGHVLSCEEGRRGQLRWGHGYAAIMMATLKVSNYSLYRELGKGSAHPILFGKFLTDKLPLSADWWFGLYMSGTKGDRNKNRNDAAIYLECGFITKVEDYSGSELSSYTGGWGSIYDDPFVKIYGMMESVDSFDR